MSIASSRASSAAMGWFQTEQGHRVVSILTDLAAQADETLHKVSSTPAQWSAALATLQAGSPTAMDEAVLKDTLATIKRRCPDFGELLREAAAQFAQRRFQSSRGPVRIRVPSAVKLLRLFYDQFATSPITRGKEWNRYDYFQRQRIVQDIAKAAFEISLLGNVQMVEEDDTNEVGPDDSVSRVGVGSASSVIRATPPLTAAALERHVGSVALSAPLSRTHSVAPSSHSRGGKSVAGSIAGSLAASMLEGIAAGDKHEQAERAEGSVVESAPVETPREPASQSPSPQDSPRNGEKAEQGNDGETAGMEEPESDAPQNTTTIDPEVVAASPTLTPRSAVSAAASSSGRSTSAESVVAERRARRQMEISRLRTQLELLEQTPTEVSFAP